jgi:Na+-transporting NADH:ubiquinone oxidoreductase subunit C
MPSEAKTIAFAAIVCVVCSVFLAGTRSSLQGRIAFNEENDRKLNVLRAFHPEALPDGTPLSPEDYVNYFDEGNLPPALIDQYFQFVETIFIDLDGNVLEGKTEKDFDKKAVADKTRSPLPLYVWREKDEIKKYAFPMYGKGLWSTIYSYISLKPDLAEIKGVTFYGHKETPGLGGEASKPWFQRNFIGKKLYEEGKPVEFYIAKGKVSPGDPNISHKVDGLAGATITAKGIQKFINADFAVYNRYFDKIRGK